MISSYASVRLYPCAKDAILRLQVVGYASVSAVVDSAEELLVNARCLVPD